MKTVRYGCGCAITWTMLSRPENETVERVTVCAHHRPLVDTNADLGAQARRVTLIQLGHEPRAQEVVA